MAAKKICEALACILLGYLIGCINPSYMIGKKKGYDVRNSGSKNAGASNTVIMAGKKAGLFVALFDIFKAMLAWKLCKRWSVYLRVAGIIGGVACIIGHMFPVFLGFRGGKGLACLGGVCLAYEPRALLIMLAVAIFIGLVTNYVCIVTVSMSIIFPAYYGIQTGDAFGFFLLMLPSIPIFIKHIENFQRIRDGKELRLSYLLNKDKEIARIQADEK